MGMGSKHHISAALPSEKRPGTHCTGDRVGTVAENFAPTGIQFLDRPDCSESLF